MAGAGQLSSEERRVAPARCHPEAGESAPKDLTNADCIADKGYA